MRREKQRFMVCVQRLKRGTNVQVPYFACLFRCTAMSHGLISRQSSDRRFCMTPQGEGGNKQKPHLGDPSGVLNFGGDRWT